MSTWEQEGAAAQQWCSAAATATSTSAWSAPPVPSNEALRGLLHVWRATRPVISLSEEGPEGADEEILVESEPKVHPHSDHPAFTIIAQSLAVPETRITLLLSLLSLRPRSLEEAQGTAKDIILLAKRDTAEWVRLLGILLAEYPEKRCATDEGLGEVVDMYDMRIEMLISMVEASGIYCAGPVDAYLSPALLPAPEASSTTHPSSDRDEDYAMLSKARPMGVEDAAKRRMEKLTTLAASLQTSRTAHPHPHPHPSPISVPSSSAGAPPSSFFGGSPSQGHPVTPRGGPGHPLSPSSTHAPPSAPAISSAPSGSIFIRRRPPTSAGTSSMFMRSRQHSAGSPLSPMGRGAGGSGANNASFYVPSMSAAAAPPPMAPELVRTPTTEFGKASRVRMLDVAEGQSIIKDREQAVLKKLHDEQEEKNKKAAARKEEMEARKAQDEERRREKVREREEKEEKKKEAEAARKRKAEEEGAGRGNPLSTPSGASGEGGTRMGEAEEEDDTFRRGPVSPVAALPTGSSPFSPGAGPSPSDILPAIPPTPSASGKAGPLDETMNALTPEDRTFIEAFMRGDRGYIQRALAEANAPGTAGKAGTRDHSIILHKEEPIRNPENGRVYQASLHFVMDLETMQWRKVKRRARILN